MWPILAEQVLTSFLFSSFEQQISDCQSSRCMRGLLTSGTSCRPFYRSVQGSLRTRRWVRIVSFTFCIEPLEVGTTCAFQRSPYHILY